MSTAQTPAGERRVMAYIDGFNLYFGLKASNYQRYLWLDLVALAGNLTQGTDGVVGVRYFTSLISGPPAKRQRQTTYLEALQTHCGAMLRILYGKYQTEDRMCRQCGSVSPVPSEKKTDVNIAVEMMVDAYSDAFDTAFLVTADSDLLPPLEAIRRLFPQKRIVVAFPPGRNSMDLRRAAQAFFTIGRAKFARSQLPESVVKPNGTVLTRPPTWT